MMNSDKFNLNLKKIQERNLFRCSIICLLIALTIIIFIISLSFGAVKIPLKNIIQAIFSLGKSEGAQIIWYVRLPRIIVACLAGASLALSGTILQAVMRNPLASPGIIGTSAGAALGAVIIIISIPTYFDYLIPAAFIGAFSTSLLIYLLAWQGGAQPIHLILSGIAVASLLSAITNSLLISFPDRVHGTLDFMIGSLSARSWKHVHICMPYFIIGTVISLLMAKKINILMLGDDVAKSLGLNVEKTRLILLAISSLLAASAVSIVGLLGFVGLIAPHIMRLIIGSDHKFLLPASIFFSASLLMLCDTIGRLIVQPIEIPAGILMSIIGAPFFIYLLRRKKI